MKWEDLPEILKQDRRQIQATEGKGFILLESIQTCLAEDYDIFMSIDEIIDKAAEELIQIPEYMKYARSPLTQADVHAAVKLGTSTRTYGRLVTDMYLPALFRSLQLHFRVLTNVHGYYALMHTTPMGCTEDPQNPWKVINLILTDDEKYQPVTYINENNEPTPQIPKSQFSVFPDVTDTPEEVSTETPTPHQCTPIATVTEEEAPLTPTKLPSETKQVHPPEVVDVPTPNVQ